MDEFDLLLALSPLLLCAWAIVRATQLYRHTIRREALFKESTGEKLHLRYLRTVSLATMSLVTIYFMAKMRCVLQLHHRGISETDVIMWAATDAAIFAILALLCMQGRHVADAVIRAKTVERKNHILYAMIEAAGGFVWIKDVEGRYIFCDNTFCKFFFGSKPEESVVGFTDVDLIQAYRVRYKKTHTYGELCMSTDVHCAEQKKKCRYIEIGYIDGNLVILDVIKTPLFDKKGLFDGTVGMAWERSQDCDHVKKDIAMFQTEGRLVRLCENVYWVKDSVQDCRWENPMV